MFEPPKTVFYRAIPDARKPIAADSSAAGLLPTSAYRYCEAARVASGLGWYIFPPCDFWLKYDGVAVYWRLRGTDWMHLESAQYPGFEEQFDAAAPEHLKGFCPPFLGASENGLIQIWTGLFCRTEPGWGLLIRRPPNVPLRSQAENYEGFIETDKWFGPLFANLRITKTDTEIRFEPDWPFALIQPFPKALTRKDMMSDVSYVGSLDELEDSDWEEMGEIIHNRLGHGRGKANYARKVRRG